MGARINRWWMGLLVAVLGCAVLWPATASAASAPVLAGAVSNSTTLSEVTAVAVASPVSGQTFAYATAYDPGQLTAIDVSNPASPTVAGASAPTTSLMNGSNVALAGGYAYVVSKNRNLNATNNDDGTGNALTILDVHTNPAQPTVVGFVQDPVKLFGSYGIAIQGNYAYVASQGCLAGQPCPNPAVGNSFTVVDVSNPAAPAIVASLSDAGLGNTDLDHATSVAISGHYAYVTASYDNRLTVIDISNPLSPRVVTTIKDSRLDFDVDAAIQGNYAYIADQSGVGMAIVDISNPLSPHVTGAVNSHFLNGGYRIRVRGAFAYVSAVYAETVSAVDVSDPTAPRLAASDYNPLVLNSTTGLDLDPTTHQVITTSPSLPGQSGAAAGTISVFTLDPSPIHVGIHDPSKPPNPTTKRNATFSFVANDQVSTPRCQLDGGPAKLCTSSSTQQYKSLHVGTHVFTVRAFDAAGNVATDSYKWRVGTAPKISRYRQSRSRWQHAAGTRFSFNLNQAATVRLAITQSATGRKVSGTCVRQTKKNQHQRSCQLTLTLETKTISRRRGAYSFTFHGTGLAAGRYALTALADSSGLVSGLKTLRFTILPG